MRRAVIELKAPSNAAKATVEIELRSADSVAPHRTIDLQPVGIYTELSICMQGFVRVGRRWRESVSGQGQDFLIEHIGQGPALVELCALWERWHLNGMRAWHRQQREVLLQHKELLRRVSRARGGDLFTAERDYLTRVGKNPFEGYEYGSAWLVEPLPGSVIERLDVIVAELGGKFVGEAESKIAQEIGQ